jgi:hypothetical protein
MVCVSVVCAAVLDFLFFSYPYFISAIIMNKNTEACNNGVVGVFMYRTQTNHYLSPSCSEHNQMTHMGG